MPQAKQHELNLGLESLPGQKTDLTISPSAAKPLSKAQLEFNRRMKSLEKARAAYEREGARLDQVLGICSRELMPLIEELNRANHDLACETADAWRTLKLTPRRRQWLGDLVSGQAADLLADPVGLDDADLERLQTLVEELGPCVLDEEADEREDEEFAMIRGLLEEMARQSGVDLDLSDLDMKGDPAEFERQLQERLGAAGEAFRQAASDEPAASARQRKPTKAALERERRQRELEEAKTRDFKSLYKQLAKLLHPDLETDPVLKEHKEGWMKRLTAAHANGDLRDMLEIEMEWLGEEAGNLAKASDEKLRTYSMVLKEQADELQERTATLVLEPQYGPLARFLDPFSGRMPEPARIKFDLTDELDRLNEMLHLLRVGGAGMRKMIHQWADAHARACEPRPLRRMS